MPDPVAFYSYVRKDDEHDGGQLSDLRKQLAAEVRVQTGADFLIFQDRDDVMWGQRWQKVLDAGIDTTTFLIAIMTPSFFQSEACRHEVGRFLERERALGRDDLILPVYYVSVHSTDGDGLATELFARQFEDWRDLRFVPMGDPAVRRAIAGLAGQIVAALSRVVPPGSVSAGTAASPTVTSSEDEAAGFVELVAEAEDAMPELVGILSEFSERMNDFAALANDATHEMEQASIRPRPGQARLAVTRRFAKDLEAPAAEMERLAESYVEQLARLDGGLTAMVERVPGLTDEEEIEAARDLHRSLEELVGNAQAGLDAIASLSTTLDETARLSSTVRPVLRRMKDALDRMAPSLSAFLRWERGFDEGLGTIGPTGPT